MGLQSPQIIATLLDGITQADTYPCSGSLPGLGPLLVSQMEDRVVSLPSPAGLLFETDVGQNLPVIHAKLSSAPQGDGKRLKPLAPDFIYVRAKRLKGYWKAFAEIISVPRPFCYTSGITTGTLGFSIRAYDIR